MKAFRSTTALGVAFCAAGMAVLYAFPPERYHFYPRCPIYAATHLLCPGCGGTRAVYELLHFNLRAALHYNALITVLAPLALVWCAFTWYRAGRNQQPMQLHLPAPVLAGLLLLTVLFTLARNTGMGFVI